ncbi:MAG: hypothetical protein Q7S27_03290 [Nanoarchaeota archaeon]|nr:hypothetical protein [Nanoarchaeota archaeon]
MFDPNYDELKQKGFQETRISNIHGEFPHYMQLYNEGTKIIVEHIVDGSYSVHRLNNRFGRNYSPIEIMADPKFEEISSLDHLISFIKKDEELSELNPRF